MNVALRPVWGQIIGAVVATEGQEVLYFDRSLLCISERACFYQPMTELRWGLFHIQLSQKRICLAREHTHNSLLYWLPYRWNSQPLYSYLINEMLWFVCWFMSVLNDYKSIKMFSIITREMLRDWESLKFCDLVSILKVMQTHSFLFTVQNIEGFFFLSLHVLGINQQLIFSPPHTIWWEHRVPHTKWLSTCSISSTKQTFSA